MVLGLPLRHYDRTPCLSHQSLHRQGRGRKVADTRRVDDEEVGTERLVDQRLPPPTSDEA